MWPLVILALLVAVAPGFEVLVFERQCAITHKLRWRASIAWEKDLPLVVYICCFCTVIEKNADDFSMFKEFCLR
jgi:hypothetical protein